MAAGGCLESAGIFESTSAFSRRAGEFLLVVLALRGTRTEAHTSEHPSASAALGCPVVPLGPDKSHPHVDLVCGVVGIAGNELLPRLVALVDDLGGVALVLCLSAEGKLVLGLSVRDFVDSEPCELGKLTMLEICQSRCRQYPALTFVRGSDQAGEVSLDVLNVVELAGERVVDVNDEDLPVRLALVEQGHDAEDLDLLDLSAVADGLANLADVERVVVALCLCLWVGRGGVLPGLGEGAVYALHGVASALLREWIDLGEQGAWDPQFQM